MSWRRKTSDIAPCFEPIGIAVRSTISEYFSVRRGETIVAAPASAYCTAFDEAKRSESKRDEPRDDDDDDDDDLSLEDDDRDDDRDDDDDDATADPIEVDAAGEIIGSEEDV